MAGTYEHHLELGGSWYCQQDPGLVTIQSPANKEYSVKTVSSRPKLGHMLVICRSRSS